MIITQSETSDEAVKKFDASMSKLQKLDIAKGYVELLSTIEQLRSVVLPAFESSA